MGDDGRLYVDPDVVPVYRDVLLPMSTIITPNWFEVACVAGSFQALVKLSSNFF